MGPGQYHLQLFVSLAVTVGAAMLALICDFLKRNNDQLRELTVELNVRREEEQRRYRTMVPQPDAAETKPEKRIETRASRSLSSPREPKRAVAPEALAAMERGAQLAGAPRPRAAAAPPAHELGAAPAGESVASPKPMKTFATKRKDWDYLLARRPSKKHQVIDVQVEPSNAAAPVPAGFHDGFILSQLLQKRQPVSGLVVSIGVNTPREVNGALPEPVKELIQSLIAAGDFACQSSDEEFLLIYPNEHGAAAQRKLSQIARQLWDFQLSSMGTFSLLFSWGGVEVASESLEEAVASANERMQQTRRSRKMLIMPGQIAQAV